MTSNYRKLITLLELIYLFSKRVDRGKISVSLAVNGGIGTATDGIHFPVSVVIVHHMKIHMPAPEF